ncbi:cell division inhibitor [Vibrio ishigakensis]|uniref:Cell division inhibitor n=1 Tax=Vibrio ishigakensis TaxID=1481914 RepID=A0A0B8NRJ0_9VIBR|nr:cell division inhibitor [Vibrio ishigakensis]
MGQFTIFYDGTCPLCVKEMTALRKQDEDRQLLLVDIHEQQFLDYPYIDGKEASAMLHAWMKTVSCC